MSRTERRVQVLETLYRLQTAIDRRDWNLIRATFLPDASGYQASGIENIIATMQAHLGGVGRTQHLIGNSIVEFSEDGLTAVVTSYARVYHVGAGAKRATSSSAWVTTRIGSCWWRIPGDSRIGTSTCESCWATSRCSDPRSAGC